MFCYIEMGNSPTIMGEYEENEQHFECRRWHDKEVDSDKFFQV
ncbi:MAG: hypothetical protein QF609_00275 [Gammaproteobacteria bacterium]|nr:hypothetical protein [Gammaproteobacteria bacterium]